MPLFFSFEGGEGTGKSTQVEILRRRLKAASLQVRVVHEPGTTPLGEYLRNWLKREGPRGGSISSTTELFLFAAARSELAAKIFDRVSRQDNSVIIADRYSDSTVAYQGYGRGVSIEAIEVINRLATHGYQPDITFLLDADPELGLKRTGTTQLRLALETDEAPTSKDRGEEGVLFEEESPEFHRRVRQGYLHMAEKEPKRWRVLDASQSPADTNNQVAREIECHLGIEIPPISAAEIQVLVDNAGLRKASVKKNREFSPQRPFTALSWEA